MQPSGRSSGSVRIQPHSPPRFATFGFRKDFSCRGKQAVYCIADVAAAGPNDIRSMRHLVTQTISQVGRARGRTELTELNIEHPEAVGYSAPLGWIASLARSSQQNWFEASQSSCWTFFYRLLSGKKYCASCPQSCSQAELSHSCMSNNTR